MSRRTELVGWRVWDVSNGFLLSVAVRHVWAPKLIVPAIGAGYHAFKTEEQALTYFNTTVGGIPPFPSIIGEVLLWGRIIEHTEGYLAQFAYPKRLFHLGNISLSDLIGLGQYGVPILKHAIEWQKIEEEKELANEALQQQWAAERANQRRRTREKYKALIARAKELGIWESVEAEAKRQANDR